MYEKFDVDGIKSVLQYVSNKFIICCHGLFSNKDSDKYKEIEKMALENGISCVRFDFYGCGESDGEFEDSILSNRINDLEKVIDYISKKSKEVEYALFGSSFGGMVCIACASKKKIKSMVIMSTPYKIEGILDEKFARDLKKYDMLELAKFCSHTLIVHGKMDELVPCEHANKIYEKIAPPKKILFFDADHSFSEKKERKKALEEAIKWFEKYF